MFERDAVTSPEEPFARLAWEVCFEQRKSVRFPESASHENERYGRHSRIQGGRERCHFRGEHDKETWVVLLGSRRMGQFFSRKHDRSGNNQLYYSPYNTTTTEPFKPSRNTPNTPNTSNNEPNWNKITTRNISLKKVGMSNAEIKNSIKRKYADSILRALDKIAGSKNNKNMNSDNINAREYLKQEAMNNLIKLIENYPNQDQLGKILKNSKSKLRGTNININTLRNLYREVEPFSKKSGGYTRH